MVSNQSSVVSPEGNSPEGNSPEFEGGAVVSNQSSVRREIVRRVLIISYFLLLTSYLLPLPLTSPPRVENRNDINTMLVFINLVMNHIGKL